MIEIDHQQELEPQPARPILANQLLDLEEKQRRRFLGGGRTDCLGTGCDEIDDLLGGDGIERGIVVGISSDGIEGRLISLHLLSTVLISRLSPDSSRPPPKSKAIVIDTTGSFPLPLLAKVLKSRLREARGDKDTSRDVDVQVRRCLEMVALSRVFDIEGLWEVLSEIGSPSLNSTEAQEEDLEKEVRTVDENPDKPPEVVDSEEELSSLEDDYDIHAPPKITKPEPEPEAEDPGTEILIIDTMTHIINELFARKDKTEAHTLLTLLSTSLHLQTRSQNILTILHNTTTSSTSKYPPQSHHQTHQQQTHQPSSLFPSNPHKPSLGQIFTQFPTLHLFLSSLPRTQADAEALYGGSPPGSPSHETHPQNRRHVNYTTVLEILKDEAPLLPGSSQPQPYPESGKRGKRKRKELGYREGTWCAISVAEDGLGFRRAFEEKGGMRGLGLERGSGEIVNFAKLNGGFGGRRV